VVVATGEPVRNTSRNGSPAMLCMALQVGVGGQYCMYVMPALGVVGEENVSL